MNVKELRELLENTPDNLEVFSMTPSSDVGQDPNDPVIELFDIAYAGVLEEEGAEPFFALIAPECAGELMDNEDQAEED